MGKEVILKLPMIPDERAELMIDGDFILLVHPDYNPKKFIPSEERWVEITPDKMNFIPSRTSSYGVNT